MPDRYTLWQQQQKLPLFEAAGTWWRLYRHTLVPAAAKPQPFPVTPAAARNVLRKSGAYLLRTFTRVSEVPTEFWYLECPAYSFDTLTTKMRTKIRRAYKDCTVRKIDASWLAQNGYPCYAAAFARHKSGTPDAEELFRRKCFNCADGPFDFWGAFVGDILVAFAKCVVAEDFVSMVMFKFDPKFSSARPSYALQDAILRTYVVEQQKPVNNGSRSLDHDTNMQDFVLQFGFQRVYTDLQIIYRQPLGSLVDLLYAFGPLINRLSLPHPVAAVKTLVRQEQIRRSCLRLSV